MKLLLSILSAACLLTACNSGANKEAELVKAKQMTIDSMKAVLAKQAVIDSMNTVIAEREEKNKQIEANNNITPQAQPQAVVQQKKKKWNNTAKGAVIGAGTGAVAGAIINKKRAEGALVGSLVGAGVGAATGLVVDKTKKNKQQRNN